MKLITKNTDYAFRALVELAAKEGKYVSALAIARAQKIPYQYLRSILQALLKAGLIESREGSGGGVKLRGKPSGTKFIDVIKIFQGDLEFSECMFRNRICENRPKCILRKELKRIEAKVAAEFKSITLEKILKEREGVT